MSVVVHQHHAADGPQHLQPPLQAFKAAQPAKDVGRLDAGGSAQGRGRQGVEHVMPAGRGQLDRAQRLSAMKNFKAVAACPGGEFLADQSAPASMAKVSRRQSAAAAARRVAGQSPRMSNSPSFGTSLANWANAASIWSSES